MPHQTADVVICGAGMAGIAAAFHLAVRRGVRDIVLVDEREPLTLTSDKGTEAYRNWWPGPDDTMLRFMNRSIDLLEEVAAEAGDCFHLSRRGYVFLTADPERARTMERVALETCAMGAGPFRRNSYAADARDGADLVLDRELIRRQFPFVTEDAVAMLHARRCGWIEAQVLGRWLLERSQEHGVRLVRDRVDGFRGRRVLLRSGDSIDTGAFVIAAGPHLKKAGEMLGIDIPVFCELHGKVAFADRLGIIPRDAPLMIWDDSGVHFRPRGELEVLIIWTYEAEKLPEPVWPTVFASNYPEVLMTGLARMIPALSAYLTHPPPAVVDGGYYCKTRENRPLIGPLPVEGAYVIGALSGYGIMASQAAGELLAAHVTGAKLPDYAAAFLLNRYEDRAYRRLLPALESAPGQL